MPPRGHCAWDLSVRSRSLALAPNNSAALSWQTLLKAEAAEGRWRLVELFGLGAGTPFVAWLRWSSGSGVGAAAKIAVTRATRVCVMARSLEVLVAHRVNAAATIGVTVADGREKTVNHWEEWVGTGTNAVPIPPFAKLARLESGDVAATAAGTIDLIDGLGTTRSRYAGDAQPSGGVPLAGAASLQTTCSANHRVVYELAL